MAFYDEIVTKLFSEATPETPVTPEAINASLAEAFPLHTVPKDTLLNANKELKASKEAIKALQDGNADNEEIQTQLADYKKQVETMQAEAKQKEQNARIQGVITANGGVDAEYLAFKLKGTGVDFETASTLDIENQLKAMKEATPALFKSADPADPADPAKATNNGFKVVDNGLKQGGAPNPDAELMKSINDAMGIKE